MASCLPMIPKSVGDFENAKYCRLHTLLVSAKQLIRLVLWGFHSLALVFYLSLLLS